MNVKIYGQKRSGTNLMEYLLRQVGVCVMVNTGGWKHGPPRRIGDRQIVIGKLRDNWTKSIERYRQPPGEERHGPDGWEVREIQYLDFCRRTKTALYIQYESLIQCPQMWWTLICNHCNIRQEFPGLPDKYMGRNGLPTEYSYKPGARVPGIHKDK